MDPNKDFDCPFCQKILTDPVLLDSSGNNACRTCALTSVVGKGPVVLPGSSTLKVNLPSESSLVRNSVLSSFLVELQKPKQQQQDERANRLCLFGASSATSVPCSMRTTVDATVCIQAPLRKEVDIDLVAVIDVSGSMAGEGKLGLLKITVLKLVDELTERDRFGLVVFNSTASVVFEISPATEQNKARWREAIRRLEAGGGTYIWAGIASGLQSLINLTDRKRNAALLLFTDGCTGGAESLVPSVKQAMAQFPMHLSFDSFAFGDHDVDLLESLPELPCFQGGHYVVVADPSQFAEARNIIFSDVKFCPFFNLDVSVSTNHGKFGSEKIAFPMTSNSDSRKGFLIPQLPAERQVSFSLKISLPMSAAGKHPLLEVTVEYFDSSLKLKRKAQLQIEILRDNSQKIQYLDLGKDLARIQENRIDTGRELKAAAKEALGKRNAQAEQRLQGKILELENQTTEPESDLKKANGVFIGALQEGKQTLRQNFGAIQYAKMTDMGNALLYERSSVFVEAFNTSKIDQANKKSGNLARSTFRLNSYEKFRPKIEEDFKSLIQRISPSSEQIDHEQQARRDEKQRSYERSNPELVDRLTNQLAKQSASEDVSYFVAELKFVGDPQQKTVSFEPGHSIKALKGEQEHWLWGTNMTTNEMGWIAKQYVKPAKSTSTKNRLSVIHTEKDSNLDQMMKRRKAMSEGLADTQETANTGSTESFSPVSPVLSEVAEVPAPSSLTDIATPMTPSSPASDDLAEVPAAADDITQPSSLVDSASSGNSFAAVDTHEVPAPTDDITQPSSLANSASSGNSSAAVDTHEVPAPDSPNSSDTVDAHVVAPVTSTVPPSPSKRTTAPKAASLVNAAHISELKKRLGQAETKNSDADTGVESPRKVDVTPPPVSKETNPATFTADEAHHVSSLTQRGGAKKNTEATLQTVEAPRKVQRRRRNLVAGTAAVVLLAAAAGWAYFAGLLVFLL